MELGADDYLFKPFTMSELIKSIDMRFSKRELLISLANETQPGTAKKLSKESNLFVMSGNHPESVKIEKILYIEALEHYCNVLTADGKKLLIRKTMKDWEEILPEELFIRIHRSTIINLDYTVRFEKWFNNTFRVYLKNIEQPFEVSRRYGAKIRDMIGEK
ncbi:MAG: response regulator transcription factor, partial [Ignavibacteriales bacterium]|nr:response regulator transcription factor [Ignavibacteriales bacterium]